MRTNILHIITAWFITAQATLSLTGCTSENELPTHMNSSEIMIRVAAPYESDRTKAEATPVTDQEPTILTGGLLIFSKADGTILNVMRVLPGITGGDVIGLNDLINGVTITGEFADYFRVDLFGNLPSGITNPAEGTDITDFSEQLQSITSITDNTGSITNVGIYGKGIINTSVKPYQAIFDATPIASRLEIQQFDMDITRIESFDIEGIFINNFYPHADLTGATDDNDLVYYFAGATFEENGEPYYSTAYKQKTYDFNKNTYIGQFSSNIYHPINSSNVWAYNIYSGEVPHVVIKFANVKATSAYITYLGYDPFAARTNWYITITGLHISNVTLPALQQGHVYTISSIEVSPGTLVPNPEPGNEVEADVQVNIVPWISVDASTSLPQLPW